MKTRTNLLFVTLVVLCALAFQTSYAQNVTVSLAYDNPSAGYIVDGQGTTDLAHFSFNGDDTITSITLERYGFSTNSIFTNVYLYDGYSAYTGRSGMIRITQGYRFNSNGEIVISNLHIVASSYMIICVKADVSSDASATSSTFEMKLTSYTVASSDSPISVNLAGNMMYVGSAPTNMASAALIKSANAEVSDTTVQLNTANHTMWADTLKISNNPVYLESVNFRFVGSASIDAVQNLKLYVDGSLASETSAGSNGYALFDLTSMAVSLKVGLHAFKVCGDVGTSDTNKNFKFLFETPGDIVITDQRIGINVPVSNIVSYGTAGLITIACTSRDSVVVPGTI